ncbi:MAG: uroporphyrinogen-III C-methyltransferase [Planctomycetaceae bacterium]
MSDDNSLPSQNRSVGTVYLVGAGAGDPGLLTMRGRECLALADVVLYDGLVNPMLLALSHAQAERTSRMTAAGGRRLDQKSINERLINAARQGKTVVRLKGGDPFLFGRGSEEAAALAAEGIPFEVVPGVTAALAAADYAGFSLTHRDISSAVALITGHEDHQKTASRLDYSSLAKFPGTLVFYMGFAQVKKITQSLIAAGMPSTTPAAVVCHASRPSQQTLTGTLDDLPQRVASSTLTPPSLIIVGDCVRQREQIAWFEKKPLFGLRIGITRPEGHADETITRCLQLGAEPVNLSAIDVLPLSDFSEMDRILPELSRFDWLVFTSVNGVTSLLDRIWHLGGDARWLGRTKLACIGPATATALERYRLRADIVPTSYRAEELAAALQPHVRGRRVLWAKATRGRDVLPVALKEAGAEVSLLEVYQNIDRPNFPEAALTRIAEGSLDWIGLSSPSIARSVAALWPKEHRAALGTTIRLAAISPVTAAAALECGLTITTTASNYTWDGLFEAIRQTHSQ